MFGILAKFFRFSGRENGNKFKLSIVIGLIEALASAMKIPAIMYILIGLLSGKPTGKYIGGSVAIMVLAIVVDVICKRYSTVLQTEGGSASSPKKDYLLYPSCRNNRIWKPEGKQYITEVYPQIP